MSDTSASTGVPVVEHDDDNGAPPPAVVVVRPHRLKTVIAATLGILCCISVLVSVVGVWARRTVFDTDAWVEQITPLASDEAILEPLGDYLTVQIMDAADIQRRMQDALPRVLDPVAIPIAAGAETYVHGLVDRSLHSERFRTAWVEMNRFAHTQMVKAIEGTGTVVQTGNPGTVSINLLPIVNWILDQISDGASSLFGRPLDLPEVTSGELPEQTRARLSSVLGRELPADFGQIVVYQSDQLGALQSAMLLFKRLVIVLMVVTVALGAGSIVLARRRGQALMVLGLGVALSLTIGRAVVAEVQSQVLALLAGEEARRAAATVLSAILGRLSDLTSLLIGIGLVLLVVGFVTSRLGPVRLARDARGSEDGGPAPVLALVGSHRQAFAAGGIGIALVVLLVADRPSLLFLGAVLALLAAYEVAIVVLEQRWVAAGGPSAVTAEEPVGGVGGASMPESPPVTG